MKDILTYAFGVVVCSALFVLFYRTVLYRRTTFLAARIYLLASLVVAAVIPALDIPVWRVAPIEIAAVAMPFEISHTAPPVTVAVPVDWLKVSLWSLYGLGIVALGLAMIRQLVHIANIKLRAEIFRTEECRLAVSEEVSTPFSFLGTIFIGREISGTEMRQIVLHEASHVRHRHSQEKIAMETIKNIMWFNPFAWWTARLLSEVHEFEADRDVLDGGFTVEEYLTLIFRQIFGYIPELSVGLGDSLTKKRFFMMKQGMRLTRYSPLRVAGALPLAAGMMMLFSFTSRPPEIIFTDVPAPVETVVAAAAAAPKPDTVVRTEYLDVVPSRNVPVAAAQNPQEPQKSEDIPMHSAEVMPTFQGGKIDNFREWVYSRLTYPKEAMDSNISGTVNLKFVIERDGSLSSVETISSPSKLLSDEAVRVVNESPKWTPGSNNGKPVRVYYVMTVRFQLHKTEGDKGLVALIPPSESAEKPTMNEVVVVARRNADTDFLFVRGVNSLSGQDPLVIIDGSEGALNSIDIKNVESFSVLNEASATALYGERGKNGAILVTTREEGDAGNTVNVKVDKGVAMGAIADVK